VTGPELLHHSLARIEGFLKDWQGDATFLVDADVLTQQVSRIQRAFRPSDRHAVAIKTNPLVAVLRELHELGMGLEAASAGELALGRAAADDAWLLWDSPVKTAYEIVRWKQDSNLLIQIDSLEELRLHQSLKNTGLKTLRINPEHRGSTQNYLQVGDAESKFGIPIHRANAITEAYRNDTSIVGLHLHGGSGLMHWSDKIEELRRVLGLAIELHSIRPLRLLNIGGGLGFDYENHAPADLEGYAVDVISALSEFQLEEVSLITEMGRWIHAPAGHSISKVAYIKGQNAVLHIGADAFVREAYGAHPIQFHAAVFDGAGRLKEATQPSQQQSYHLCGPLCFGGDVIRRDVLLPRIEPGDFIAFLHTGANTFSLWSRHCSRFFPEVWAYRGETLHKIKSAETELDIVRFWS